MLLQICASGYNKNTDDNNYNNFIHVISKK